MYWKTKAKPELGTERIMHKFALFPTRLDDGYTVWLERYCCKVRLTKGMFSGKVCWIVAKTWKKP